MATHIYTGKIIDYSDALFEALETAGDSEAVFNYDSNGNIEIETILSDAAMEAAIDTCVRDTLLSNKHKVIKEVEDNTVLLESQGVEAFGSGKCVPCDRLSMDEYYTEYQYLDAHPSDIAANKPYVLKSIEGTNVKTTNASDILSLAESAEERHIYLYAATSNGDGSKGESTYVEDIHNALNQAALDAITDKRK